MADTNGADSLGDSPYVNERYDIPMGDTFKTGAAIGTNGVKNTNTDTRPKANIRGSFSRARNLRNAKKVHYNSEGQPNIPVNGLPERPPSVS